MRARQQSVAANRKAIDNQIAQETLAKNNAELEMATAENKIATQVINETWKAIPAKSRSNIIDFQRAWLAKKTAECNIKSAESSTDATIKETARLRCDTEITRARTTELRDMVPY